MSENEIITYQPGFMAPVVSVQNALVAYQAKKDLIDKIFAKGVDYGEIPGTKKDTLLKAGAEKATSFFGLTPKFTDAEVVNDWTGEQHGGEPFFFYRRTCSLYRGDHLIVAVDGSCNSWEKKYRYRGGERLCPECGKPAIMKSKFAPKNKALGNAPGWYCFDKKGGCGMEFAANDTRVVNQELGQVKNPDVADLVNTILKMADKRALVAATLIATGLSEYFTQDVEDFIDGAAYDVSAESPKAQPPAQPKPQADPESTGQWTSSQLAALVSEKLAANTFNAKAMLDMSILPPDATEAEIIAWGKLYRQHRDDTTQGPRTAQQSAAFANEQTP